MAAEGPYSCVSLLSAEMLEGTVPTRPASEKVPAVHGKIERRPVGWHKGVECYKRMLVANARSGTQFAATDRYSGGAKHHARHRTEPATSKRSAPRADWST